MNDRLQRLSDPLEIGFSMRQAFRRLAFGVLVILVGFVLQAFSQLLMAVTFICICGEVERGIGKGVFITAITVHLLGIVVSYVGRRRCLKNSPAITGRWLLVASIAADVAAFVTLISPRLPLPNVRELHFLPEAASMAFFLLFASRLLSVIEARNMQSQIAACLVSGGISLLLYVALYVSVPPARVAGPALPLIMGNYLAVLWSIAAVAFAVLYGSLLWRLRQILREFDETLLTHTVTSYLTEKE